jgi:hypothetical protein
MFDICSIAVARLPAARNGVRLGTTGSVILALAATWLSPASAQDEPAATASVRPALKMNRWQEDWSALAKFSARTEPLDSLKYIGLSGDDPMSYLSLGLTLRERFETSDAAAFGTSDTGRDSYVIQRLQLHADLHFNENFRFFTQLEDDRAYYKRTLSSADQDRVDLRLAFLEYTTKTSDGAFKARLGRQDFAFDLQRFVSSRDGPNVRQSFDAVWADWETGPWRVIGFVSRPVQYLDDHAWDDRSNTDFRFSTLRLERHVLGSNELSVYYSLYQRANAHYGDGFGAEHRNIFDGRFAGSADDVDWDVEAMLQTGRVGPKNVHAWAIGPRVGYTLSNVDWKPRLGLQLDVASGDSHHGDNTVGTFNPLFPNGYYFSLAGYTGYSNLVQLKPSLTIKPSSQLALLAGLGFLWRQTTNDAVYLQPNVPVPLTAGRGRRWTGSYAQLRFDYAVSANLSCALEAVQYQVGDAIRNAGGHDSTYAGVEVKFAW